MLLLQLLPRLHLLLQTCLQLQVFCVQGLQLLCHCSAAEGRCEAIQGVWRPMGGAVLWA